MVRKKDHSFRLCIDYRRVNAVTIKDAFPVPDVKDALDSLRGTKYFATIDLLSRYWQLGCQTEPASDLLSLRVEDFSSLLECLLA